MKNIFKKVFSVFFIFILLLLAGCSDTDSNYLEPETTLNNSISISDEQLYYLQQYIAIIPPFSDIKKADDNFWHDFIYNLYTHSTGNDGLIITDEAKNDWIIVEKETIDKVTKQLFGIDLPNYYPHEKDLYRNGTTFYVLLSSTKEEIDVVSTYKFIRNLKNEITFKDTEGVGYIYYELKKSDNELGFIIKSLSCTDDSPAIITKPEMTTKPKTDISEEYTYDIENLITSTLHN